MFGLFKKKNNNDNWSIEKVYNDPDSWFKDLSKEERLKNPNIFIINILGIIFVESEGIEPSSKQANNTPSTCLVFN